jgi:hypothetical protein
MNNDYLYARDRIANINKLERCLRLDFNADHEQLAEDTCKDMIDELQERIKTKELIIESQKLMVDACWEIIHAQQAKLADLMNQETIRANSRQTSV